MRNNKNIKYNKYLSQSQLSQLRLTLRERLILFLMGYICVGKFKPEGFTAPMDFYLIKEGNRYFLSYRQGWWGAFYAPEAVR